MVYSSGSKNPCSHICTGELTYILSLVAFVELLAEPLDCAGVITALEGSLK